MKNINCMPLISIIIPVYNLENTLSKCLNSVINQTYTNMEIIIINDGSTDNSEKICIEFTKEDKRIHYLYQTNKGVSFARNVGLYQATGDYITFVDGDDFIDEKHIESLYNAMIQYGADISVCGITFEKDKKYVKKFTKEMQYENLDFLKPLISYNDFGGYIWNKMYSSNIIKNTKFDENLDIAEDLLFNLQVFLNSKKIVKIKSVSYHYCINSLSATQSINYSKEKSAKKLQSYLLANEKSFEIIKNHTDNQKIINLFKQKVLFVKAEIFYFEIKYFNKFNSKLYKDIKSISVLNPLKCPIKLYIITLVIKICNSEKLLKKFFKMRG